MLKKSPSSHKGGVCVGGGGMGRRAWRHVIVAVHWSRLAHLSLLPFHCWHRPAVGDRRLAIQSTRACRKRPGSVCRRCASPSSRCSSLTTPPPLHGGDSRGPVRSQNTDGRAGRGRRATRYAAVRSLVTGVRLHTKKGDAHSTAAVLWTVARCN